MPVDELFARVLNMSITGTTVICFVLLAKLGMRKTPKVYSYLLWSVVLFRLLCPVSIAIDVSLFGLGEVPVTEMREHTTTVDFITEDQVYPRDTWKEIPDAVDTEPESAVVLPTLWIAGMGSMAAWGLWSLVGLKKRLLEAAPVEGNVWECDGLDTAFVLGLIRPKIYLPSGLGEQERRFILLHEKHHIRRLDHLWKLTAYIALCVHWFNPLVWVAFYLAERDMEMSCDEAVLKALGADSRCDYSQTLLRLSSGRRWTAAMPLAFGEGNVKERVVNVLNWKKPRLWVSIVCAVVCVALLAACGGNPGVETGPSEPVNNGNSVRVPDETDPGNLTEDQEDYEFETGPVPVQDLCIRTVREDFTDYANIQLELPDSWRYEVMERQLESDAFGIRFWPKENPDAQIELCWFPDGFGVCGTGLEEKTMILDNGESASLGYYDGSDCMSFCAYGRNYAAVNVSAHDCWDEYGEMILTILKSVDLNQAAISEERAIALIRDWVQEEWTLYRSEFDVEQGVWTFRFYEQYDGEPVDVICVDHEGNCWRHGEDQHHQDDHHSGHHHGW